MSRGPNGEKKRSGDVAQVAHRVFQIATGDAEDRIPSGKRNSGLAGAKARHENLDAAKRSEIARNAANARWR